MAKLKTYGSQKKKKMIMKTERRIQKHIEAAGEERAMSESRRN